LEGGRASIYTFWRRAEEGGGGGRANRANFGGRGIGWIDRGRTKWTNWANNHSDEMSSEEGEAIVII
jgi:hypothetical protein